MGWQVGDTVLVSQPATMSLAGNDTGTSSLATGSVSGSQTSGESTGSTTGGSSGSTADGSTTDSNGGASDGTYTGSSVNTGFGPVQVAVTISGGEITDVAAVQLTDRDGKSVQISNYAAPILRQEVLDSQSANVSHVSGATYTSAGYLQSLQSALDQAGF
ncbi:FMN-binding protein [Myceligenerans sp. I2]|uniref:FMN-binding protein n=2 Tax=Myceligenerans indicum TaxID=2593663 RepID=A0ABS1LFU5_9MICO|nr:FMN-binding protein [Myceligenerans indicum]